MWPFEMSSSSFGIWIEQLAIELHYIYWRNILVSMLNQKDKGGSGVMSPVASSRRFFFWQRWRSWRRRTGCASSRTGPPPTARRGFDVKRDWYGCHLESWRVGQVLSFLLHVLVLHALHVQLLLTPVTKTLIMKAGKAQRYPVFRYLDTVHRHKSTFSIITKCTWPRDWKLEILNELDTQCMSR